MADWTNEQFLESLGLPFKGEGCEAVVDFEKLADALPSEPTAITNIDLKPTGVPNQYTVEIKWIDEDGNAQTTTDPTPITIVQPLPATAIPIADNELDTAIRTGQVGASLLYARQDHNHPIKRQAMPTDPALTFVGAAGSSMSQSIVLDRWSDEESVTFATRSLVLSAGGVTGWDYISIPNIAGFQRPQITIEGTYRYSGTPSDQFPRAQYMGNEANHWSSTQRVYISCYPAASKPVAARRYVAITIKYTRT